MKLRELVIENYFKSWTTKDDSILEKTFATNVKYIECYGPAYNGLVQIQKWFENWQKHGKAITWDIKEFIHNEKYSICDWYFECEYDGTVDGFNGVSWIEFNDENKIIKLREYQSKVPNYYPYEI